MLKTQKIREIYAILKEVSGDQLDSRDLIESAYQFLKATEETLYEPKASIKASPPSLAETPLNLVFDELNWEVVSGGFVRDEEYLLYQSPQEILDLILYR